MNRQSVLFGLVAICAVVSTTLAVAFYLKLNQKPAPISTRVVPSVDKGGRPVPSPYERNEVKNTIIKNARQVQICYNAFLEKTSKVTEGDVKIDWQISPDGVALKPSVVYSKIQDPGLEKCLTDKISLWTFPPPPSQEKVYVA